MNSAPLIAPWIGYEGVKNGRPVRGGLAQWKAYALASNHLLGRGSSLIPWSRINTEIDQNATTTLQFVVWPRAQATHRVWAMTYGTTTAFPPCAIRFTDPSGGTSESSISSDSGGTTLTTFHTETITDTAANELAPTWTEVNDIGAPKLLWLACFEMPRPSLAASEYGVDVDTLGQGRSIYTTTGVGPGAVVDAVSQAWTLAPRNGLFHFARGHVDYLTLSSGSWTPVFASGAVPFLRARREMSASTTKTVGARVRASSGAGTTGTVRMTMASGAVVTFSITSAMAEAWLDEDLDIATDDFATGALTDSCLIEWQRTGGANSINLHSISIGNG